MTARSRKTAGDLNARELPRRGADKARVAMFVLGDCENDGRVRKEATTLHAHGYDVCIFAMATRTHGPGQVSMGGVLLDRLPAMSWPQRLLLRWPRRVPTGVRERAVSKHGRPRTTPWLTAQARDAALRVHRPTLALSYTRLAVAAASRWNPDVVHAHDLPALPAAVLVARGRRPLVYDSHELWRRRNRRGQWRPLGRVADALIEHAVAPRAAVVVTVCDSIATWLDRRYELRRAPVVVRNLPLLPRPITESPNLRVLAGVEDGRVLLYTGRLMEGRGLEFAVRALHALPADVVFVLMGYGDPAYVAGLRSMATRHGVSERVRMVEAVPAEQVSSVASAADVAYVVIEPICKSYRYALPTKLFEAIAAGVPVLAADLPEIREVVVRHGVGEVFTPASAAEFRAAFDRVLAGAPRYRHAAEEARKALTWSSEQQHLLDAYESLASVTSAQEALQQ